MARCQLSLHPEHLVSWPRGVSKFETQLPEAEAKTDETEAGFFGLKAEAMPPSSTSLDRYQHALSELM